MDRDRATTCIVDVVVVVMLALALVWVDHRCSDRGLIFVSVACSMPLIG